MLTTGTPVTVTDQRSAYTGRAGVIVAATSYCGRAIYTVHVPTGAGGVASFACGESDVDPIEAPAARLSGAIVARCYNGENVRDAFDAVIGAGAFDRLAGDVWQALRAA